MKPRIVLFVVAYLVWLLLNWPADMAHLLAGIFAAYLAAVICSDLFVKSINVFSRPLRYVYFLTWYVPVFIWECFKANLDVAYRVLHPGLPIKPGIVKVKTSLKTDTALTFLANSITLTPGTMTVDIDKDNQVLYVHWINVAHQDIEQATAAIVSRFEKMLGKIFE